MFRFLKWAGGLSIGLLATWLIACWLWGSTAVHHINAFIEGNRKTLLEVESQANKSRAVDHQIVAARKEVQQIAATIGEVRGGKEEANTALGRLREEQKKDESLLRELKLQLEKFGCHPAIKIGNKDFCRAEVEHDATIILDRHQARTQEIKAQQARLTEFEQRHVSLLSCLRNQHLRILQLEVGQEKVKRLMDQKRFNERLGRLDTRPGTEALTQAEKALADLIAELNRDIAATQVHQEVTGNGPTPVAEAIAQTKNAGKLEGRIAQVVGP